MVSRAEHRRETLLKLCAVAVEVVEEVGFDVTVATIAKRAGVSARTVHRYVDGKEDLFFVHFDLAAEFFTEAASAVASRPFAERFNHGVEVVSDFLESHAELVQRSIALWPQHAPLSRGYAVMFHGWVAVFAQEARRNAPSLARFRSSVLGSALMGIVDASMVEWVMRAGASSLAEIIAEGVQTLGAGFLRLDEDCASQGLS